MDAHDESRSKRAVVTGGGVQQLLGKDAPVAQGNVAPDKLFMVAWLGSQPGTKSASHVCTADVADGDDFKPRVGAMSAESLILNMIFNLWPVDLKPSLLGSRWAVARCSVQPNSMHLPQHC